MDLKQLVSRWLKDEFPNWEVVDHGSPSIPLYYIRYRPLRRDQVRILENGIEFDDDKSGSKLTILAHDTRFFELLWNRLHSMESGFIRAIASRDFHRPESK